MFTTNYDQVVQMLKSLSSEELDELILEVKRRKSVMNVEIKNEYKLKYDIYIEEVETGSTRLVGAGVAKGSAEYFVSRLNRVLSDKGAVVYLKGHDNSNNSNFEKQLVCTDNYNTETKADYTAIEACSAELYLLIEEHVNCTESSDYYRLLGKDYKLYFPDWMVD